MRVGPRWTPMWVNVRGRFTVRAIYCYPLGKLPPEIGQS
jgi:hypothetical protein